MIHHADKPRERDRCDRCKRYFPIAMIEFQNSIQYNTCRCPNNKIPRACLRCTLPTTGGWTHGPAEFCVEKLLDFIREFAAGREKFALETRDRIRALVDRKKVG